MALDLVDIACASGADAIKFQTFHAKHLVTAEAPKARYQEHSTPAGESQLEMLRKLELSAEDHRVLAQRCREKGILFLSTPFDVSSVDLLTSLGVSGFKISSGDITNPDLLRYIAGLRKPMIVSTGMATLGEVDDAIREIEQSGNPPVALLHCTSNYPAPMQTVNLRAIDTLRAAFSVPVGYSDHTTGVTIAIGAVARGANIIEKHFTLDRSLPGPDHQASLEPNELAHLISAVRDIERALGDGRKVPCESEKDTANVARKSLTAARFIPAGAKITSDDVHIMRPGSGIAPKFKFLVIGRTASLAIAEGTTFCWDMFE